MVINTPTNMVTRIVKALPARYFAALQKRRARVGVNIDDLTAMSFGTVSIEGVYNPHCIAKPFHRMEEAVLYYWFFGVKFGVLWV